MQPKCLSPIKRHQNPSKIEHQINNEGCKCTLCQKIIFDEMMVVKQDLPQDLFEQKKQMGKINQKYPYFIKFLEHLHVFDRTKTRLRLLIPEICLFDKGNPCCLFLKKKFHLPLRLIKNKQKLNYYEIKNFFYEGYTYHNRNPEVNKKQAPLQNIKSSITFEVKNKQAIKNDSIAIARFSDNPGQMLSLNMMQSLFKYNQKLHRQSLLYIQTLVSNQNYRQIRIKINTAQLINSPLFGRAKNEAKILEQQIKQNEFGFVTQKQQFVFQQALMKDNQKTYLEYMSLKLVLMNSLTAHKMIEEGCFKWVKGNGDYYYFIDLQVYKFVQKQKIWGCLIQQAFNQKSIFQRNSKKSKSKMKKLLDISNTAQSEGNKSCAINSIKNQIVTPFSIDSLQYKKIDFKYKKSLSKDRRNIKTQMDKR